MRFSFPGFRTAHLSVQVGGLLLGIAVANASGLDLIDAASAGRLVTVEGALATGIDPDETDEMGRTAVWHAASKGHADVVAALAARGVALDEVDRFGVSAVTVSVKGGHVASLRALLKSGASPDRVEGATFVPLHVAVERGEAEMVDLLLAAGADPLAQVLTGDPTTDLTRHTMIRLRLRGMLAERIVLQGSDGLARMTFPIEAPREISQIRVIDRGGNVLFEKDVVAASPSLSFDWDGQTNDGSRVTPDRYTFRLIYDDGTTVDHERRVVRVNEVSIYEAAAFGTAGVLREILADGVAVDQGGAQGRTPLMLAAAFANVETARVLIAAGASVFATDCSGDTPLDYARTYSPAHAVFDLIQAQHDRLTID